MTYVPGTKGQSTDDCSGGTVISKGGSILPQCQAAVARARTPAEVQTLNGGLQLCPKLTGTEGGVAPTPLTALWGLCSSGLHVLVSKEGPGPPENPVPSQ